MEMEMEISIQKYQFILYTELYPKGRIIFNLTE